MSSTGEESFDVHTAKLKPGTVAIVTGAADGLGKSFARGLLQKGAKGVCLADVNVAKGAETLREFTGEFGEDRVMFVSCDVTSSSDVEGVFAKAKERFGTVNVMVNNAGIVNERKPELCIAVNITGVTTGTYTAIKYMSAKEGGKGGKIINISSLAGLVPGPMFPVYGATKSAVISLTKSLATDTRLAAQGITFGVLCPGFVRTAMITNWVLRYPDEDQKMADELLSQYGALEIAKVRDAFLRLLLDESWTGKVMKVTNRGGIQNVP